MYTNKTHCTINMLKGKRQGTEIQPNTHCFLFWHCHRPHNLKISHNKVSTNAK